MRPLRDYPSFFYGWAAGSLATLLWAEMMAPTLVGKLFRVQWVFIQLYFWTVVSWIFGGLIWNSSP